MERLNELMSNVVRHFKGDLYGVCGIAEHTETGEKLVIYQALYGSKTVYARPAEMFLEEVPAGKENPMGQQYRFELYDGGMND